MILVTGGTGFIGSHTCVALDEAKDIPNNLMPFFTQVAAGKREQLKIFGNHRPTPDGTGVRDYIHVVDLAQAQIAALDFLDRKGGLLTVNLGTGRGYSVLQMIDAFERASGRQLPYRVVGRRAGDIAQCWTDSARAQALLGWTAKRNLDSMCADAWRWQQCCDSLAQ